MITWKIIYKQKGNKINEIFFNKKHMIEEYLNILNQPFTDGISELKIFKNEKDYTQTLNKFLYK